MNPQIAPIPSDPADDVVRDLAIGAAIVRLVDLLRAGSSMADALERIAAEERATTAYAAHLQSLPQS